MELIPFLRRAAVLLAVAAVVAGCTAPQESGPADANCDGDRDGIPDGQSPVEGTNSTCEDPGNATMPEDDGGENETEPTMPGLLP